MLKASGPDRRCSGDWAPLAFTICTGDNADNTLYNEIRSSGRMTEYQDAAGRAWRLSPRLRRIAARFAEVACPPQVRAEGRIDGVLAELEALLGALPAAARRVVVTCLVLIDQAARLYPRARGRRLAWLSDRVAEGYLGALLGSRRGLAAAAQRVKALIVMCYYELPQVQEEIGYRPQAYIGMVSRRRLASYGAQIRAGEAAVLAPARDAGTAGSPGQEASQA
jgi:hypothetical protein